MQKWAIGLLAVLVLFLAALNARLSDRARLLEERLAAAEQRKAPAAAPAPLAKTPEPKPEAPGLPGKKEPPLEPRSAVEENTGRMLRMTFDGDGRDLPLSMKPNLPEPEPESAGRRPGFLGIMGEDVPGGGVKINGVVADSVAVGSGLLPNDVLLEYNGDPIPTLSALSTRVRDSGEGAPVSFRIRRGGAEFYQGVQLGARGR